jgi:BMFP domain-containing protein YqiC
MGEEDTQETKRGLSDRIRGGLEGSLRSFGRIEAEGEKVVRGLVDLAEKYGLDSRTKAIEDLRRDARGLLNQLNETVEESTKRVLERLNVPTKEDLDLYNKKLKVLIDQNVIARLEKRKVPSGRDFESMARQLSASLEEQVRKGLARLNLATRKDVETVAADLRKLRKTVDKLTRTAATVESKAAPKKPASKKTAPTAKAVPR